MGGIHNVPRNTQERDTIACQTTQVFVRATYSWCASHNGNMSSFNKEKAPEGDIQIMKIRITITSTDVKKVEKGTLSPQAEGARFDRWSDCGVEWALGALMRVPA